MINIFGKLYTLLRRPQPGEVTPAEEATEEPGPPGGEPASSQDATNQQEPAAGALGADLMTASCHSEFEHISAPAEDLPEKKEFSNSGTNIDAPVYVPGKIVQNDSGTNIDALAETQTSDKPEKDSKPVGNETLDLAELKKLMDDMTQAEAGDHSKQMKKDDVEVEGKGSEEAPTTPVVKDCEEMKGSEEAPSTDKRKHGRDKKDRKDSTGTGDQKVCKYFKRGAKCWKGHRCPFEHIRNKDNRASHGDSPAVKAETPEKLQIKESDFPCFSEYVAAMTEAGTLVDAKDLMYKLGYQKDSTTESMGKAVIGQYKIAVGKSNWEWVKRARYFAEMFFSADWIYENMPLQGKGGKPRKPKPKKHVDPGFALTADECRDFRIKTNPDMNVYTANAAGDGNLTANKTDEATKPVSESGLTETGLKSGLTGTGKPACTTTTPGKMNGHGAALETGNDDNKEQNEIQIDTPADSTEQVLQDAMKQALQDGLSESIIMEVINDVATVETPRKRAKLAKVDLSLPVTREPVDQIAFGFNYHADKLVKESPVSSSGEILVPGVPNTPSRKARDQLAVGFNYHADLLAQTAAEIDEDDIIVVDKNTPKRKMKNDNENLKPEINGNQSIDKENIPENIQMDNSTPRKGARRSINDIYAVGFSYNSNLFMKNSLDEVNGNLPNANEVASIIEDASLNENRNNDEAVVEDLLPPLVNTPAGSVW